MQRTRPRSADARATRTSRARRGGLAAAALLVATTGLATLATGADAAPKKKSPVAVAKVAGVPKTVTGASAFRVTTTVRNATRKPAKASVVFALSKDKKLDSKDVKLTSAKTGPLRPEKTKKLKTALKITPSIPEGPYFVLACVRSSCKTAKTYVLRAETPPPSASDKGTLTGSLSFTKDKPFENWTDVKDNVQLNVAMNYVGPFEAGNDLVSTGSSYTYSTKHSGTAATSTECLELTTDVADGSGPLAWTGDRYTDGIYGAVTMGDFSEVRVTVVLKYAYKRTVTKTGPEHCSPGTKEEAGNSQLLVSMLLGEVSRSGSDVTYKVKDVTGTESRRLDLGTPSGTLTLHLG